MSWTSILPKEIDIKQLNFEQCRDFKNFYSLLTEEVGGPPGYQIFHRFKLHLLFYGICCLEEKSYPQLNKCWSALEPYFLTSEYDNEWLVYFWIFCDFPLEEGSDKTILDHFYDFVTQTESKMLAEADQVHFDQFVKQLKGSRLGLYQETLSTAKVTKFKELFTGEVISTVRSVPDYERGEIFLGRIVSYLGDSFLIHDPRNFPGEAKTALENMVRNKLFYISDSGNEAEDYVQFMRLAGPYWMSVTHNDENDEVPIFDPNEYKMYYMLGSNS